MDITGITEWIDKETGHRVKIASGDSYTQLPYFTSNIFSADGKYFVYLSPDGIQTVNLPNFKNDILVPFKNGALQIVEFGKKTSRLYYMLQEGERQYLESIDIYTKKIIRHAPFPKNYVVMSINADETLALGLSEDMRAKGKKYNGKADKIYTRYKENVPMTLFTINLANGNIKDIYLSTDWLSHPQFSPTDPTLIMYSLEGPWHLVDRIWLIDSNGKNNRLVHKRTKDMEIAGHEFWSADGKSVIYDWQNPKGENIYIASYDIATQKRTAVDVTKGHCSVHYNTTENNSVLIGDGTRVSAVPCAAASTFIYRYKSADPKSFNANGIGETLIEPLVDLAGHNYAQLEPNSRTTKDGNWVIFMSDMFGTPKIFAVNMKKPTGKDLPVISTSEMAKIRAERYRKITLKN